MTYDLYGESGLVGNIVGTVQTSDTTIRAEMKDAQTGAARIPDAATKLFCIGAKTKKFELFLCASHSTDASGVTTFADCVRWLGKSGYALTAGSGNDIHLSGDSIISAPAALTINQLVAWMNGLVPGGAEQFGGMQVIEGEDYATYGYWDGATFTGIVRRKVADTKICEFYGSDDAWHSLETVGAHGTSASIQDHADVLTETPGNKELLQFQTASGKYESKTIGEALGDAAEAAYSYAADVGSTDAYAITLTPAPSAYAVGREYSFKANTVNTGACTLQIGALAAVAIKKNHDQDMETGDIEAGQIVRVVWDGTNMQMQTPVASDLTTAEKDVLAGGASTNADGLHTHPLLNRSFGAWASKNSDTVYQAESDGWVIGTASLINTEGYIRCYTDSSNPPTTLRQEITATNDKTAIMFPVRRNDYWKVTLGDGIGSGSPSATLYWIPLSA